MSIFDQLEHARNWDEDDKLILSQVDRLCADVIAPNAKHADTTGEFPWANVKAINELGLNGVFIPEDFGGAPMSFRLYLAIVKRISEACASTGIIYATNFHAMKPYRVWNDGTEGTAAAVHRRRRPRVAGHHRGIRGFRRDWYEDPFHA